MDLSPQYFDDLISRNFNPQGPVTPQAAPASTLDAATQARLAQARAMDTAAVNASRAQVAAPSVAPTAQASGGFGARVASTLNPNMGTLAKGAGRIGKAGLALAPLFGLISAAATSTDDVNKNIPANGEGTFGGRILGNAVNFLGKTGDAASFGVASRIGRVLNGGSFFEPAAPAAAAAPVAPVAPSAPAVSAAPAAHTGSMDESDDFISQAMHSAGISPQQGQTDNPVMRSIKGAMDYQPMPGAYGGRPSVVSSQPYGGGYIQRTGGPEGAGERVDLPSGTTTTVRRNPYDAWSNFYNTQQERNASREDQRIRIEGAKTAVGLIGAGKRSADEMIARAKLSAFQQHLATNPNDIDGAIAVLSGKPSKEIVGTVTSPTGATTAIQRGVNGKHTGITVNPNGTLVEQPVYSAPPQSHVDEMLKNKTSAAHKSSFIARYGQDAYKTYIEKK